MFSTYLYLRVDSADLVTAVRLGAEAADDEVPEGLRRHRSTVVKVRSDPHDQAPTAGRSARDAILAGLRNAGVSWEEVGAGVTTSRAA